MNLKENLILNVDSYKCSMKNQYPAGTTGVYSYIESRGGRYDETVMFGLQAFIKESLLNPITMEDIDEAELILSAHGEPFYREEWEYILDEYDGYMPVKISAVPEGMIIPVKNVLAVIENTDPRCYWLTTWLETALLRAVWYPVTVATQSHKIKQIIAEYLERTGTPEDLPFKLHDFGARGVSSFESAGLGGMAHLVNFAGTDTITGILYARRYYSADMPAFSVPAAEHSTITSWGKDGEVDAYRNMLKQFGKEGAIVSVVSDSYDIFNAAENLWGDELKQEVIDSGATLVVRPDSGDPVEINRKLIKVLGQQFGYTVNEKGYRVLNNVRILQGDGVNELSIRTILSVITMDGWSADNMVFGMGGKLLQADLDRDTQKFAMKCSAAEINGEWVDVFKDPITDQGKKSKKGRVTLWKSGDEYETAVSQPKRWTDKGTGWVDVLVPVYYNGELVTEYTFDEVRANTDK